MRLALLLLVWAAGVSAQDPQTHVQRGLEYLKRLAPGPSTPENVEQTRLAGFEFEAALRIDPNNLDAVRSMAKLRHMEATGVGDLREKIMKLEEAEVWYRRLASLDSRAIEAPYSLGVMAWAKAYPQVAEAKAKLGMRPEDPPPIKDASVRNDLLGRVGGLIQDGIVQLETALAIEPNYDHAMAYLNLLHRLRANLSPTEAEAQQQIAMADEWIQKAMSVKRAKSMAPGSGAPPPPPPPPPPAEVSTRAAVVPKLIRVGGNVQAAKLVHAPTPVYPPLATQARIQGVVRFDVTIAEDGRVMHMTLVSGHPLLVPSATDVVREYVYQPTLLNGTPVQVNTVVDVNFTM